MGGGGGGALHLLLYDAILKITNFFFGGVGGLGGCRGREMK